MITELWDIFPDKEKSKVIKWQSYSCFINMNHFHEQNWGQTNGFQKKKKFYQILRTSYFQTFSK